MRLGFFGGSFDPPHLGHLLAAIDAVEALDLDRLVLIPAHVQPLKATQVGATAPQRLAMTRLMVDGDSRFDVDAIEIDRAGLSYTVDTLTALARRHPADERFLLVGADAMASFDVWREPHRILELARVVVLRRPGQLQPLPSSAFEMTALDTRLVDVSSTEVRARVRAGKSVRGFVSEAVAAYIETERLYR